MDGKVSMDDEKRHIFDDDTLRVVLILRRDDAGVSLEIEEYQLAEWYDGLPPWWGDGRPVCSICHRPPRYCRCDPLADPPPPGDR